MNSGNNQIFNTNEMSKSVISSNLSFFKGKVEDLKQFYQEKNEATTMITRKRLRSVIEREEKHTDPYDMSDSFKIQRNITVTKITGPNDEVRGFPFKTIDEALCFLQGHVPISEFLLVISPGKRDATTSCDIFEIHGINKTSRKLLGTICVFREDLKNFEEDKNFEKYSMIVCNTPIDPKARLDFVLHQFGCFEEGESSSKQSSVSEQSNSITSSLKIDNKKSEPTLQDLLKKLSLGPKTSSDLTKFFDFAEKYKFSVIIRPDFVKFSNQLILDFFTPQENFIGTLTLTNQEIENQLKQRKELLGNLKIVEDTNDIALSKGVARFLRRFAGVLNLLYIYDYMSELIYKLYQNM